MGIGTLLLILQTWSPTPISPDSAEALRDLAHRAEWSYEYLLRSLAPIRRGYYPSSQRCDEIVGRFCLTFSSGSTRPRPDTTEASKVISARQQAVEMLRRAFSALPNDLVTVGPLLRYLIEDGRAEEAIAAARTFAWASSDSAWSELLLGYALHAAEDDSLAEVHFLRGLERLPEAERREIESVAYLLEPRERSLYNRMSAEERAAYEEALWRLANPLYLTPGNERYAEHLARHVWSRLLSVAPKVRRMHRWGKDLEQLTVRYGVPTSRERLLADHLLINTEETMVEYFDPNQLAYLPETLYYEGIPPTPPPGSAWVLEKEKARSGYHPLTIRKLYPLEHQVSRFQVGADILLRIDASLALDSTAIGAAEAESGLFILDRKYRLVGEERGAIEIGDDTARFHYETLHPPGDYVYSIELFEPETRLAGRARYSIELPVPWVGQLALSDPLITEPLKGGPEPEDRGSSRLKPRPSLILSNEDTIGIYLEAYHLDQGADGSSRYQVELTIGRAEEPSLIARAFGWLGRKIGLSRPAETPRLAWEGVSTGSGPAILAVDLPLDDLEPGLYLIEIEVQDLISDGEMTATSSRLIRIGDDG